MATCNHSLRVANLMPNIKVTKEDVTKIIMPNRCDICTIGIGTSMLFYENTWRPFKHYEPIVYVFHTNNGRLKVCKECFEELNAMKEPEEYIKYQSD